METLGDVGSLVVKLCRTPLDSHRGESTETVCGVSYQVLGGVGCIFMISTKHQLI